MADELFELRNYFYLGNFATAITEGETVSLDDNRAILERDIVLSRIQLAQGHHEKLLKSIADDAAAPLQLVKQLARLDADPSSATDVAAAVGAIAAAATADDASAASEPCFDALCAIAYARLGDFDNALRAAHRVPRPGLEERAIAVHVLLAMDRPDVAQREVAAMQAVDEDATLTQLAVAWVHLAGASAGSGAAAGMGAGGAGEEGAQEALYIFQDLLERHGATDTILNGMAVCHLAMAKPEESERVLNEALAKNQNCPSSLVNVICTSKYRNKPAELVGRYFTQLEKVDPANAWLTDYRAKEAEFDQLAEQLAIPA